MGRGITLKGAAAGAFVEAMAGRRPRTEEDKHTRIATFVHLEMKLGTRAGEERARAIVRFLAEHGVDETLDAMEGRKL
jgi:hypothetical protein